LRHKSVLSKYDEEIEGEKKKSFQLESGGAVDGSWEKELQSIRETLHNQAQSLELPGLKIASESRGRGRRRVEDSDDEEHILKEALPQSDDLRVESMDISDHEMIPDSPFALEEDELETELEKRLEKNRRLKQLQQQKEGTEKVVSIVKKVTSQKSQDEGDDDDDDDKKGSIVFNATSEFCRTLGEIPTYGLAGNREDQEDLMDFEKEDEESEKEGGESDGEENVGWSMVNLDEEKNQHEVC
ncbi:hypothetical protein AB205_0038870, partial [Aquarana catesbeiana]